MINIAFELLALYTTPAVFSYQSDEHIDNYVKEFILLFNKDININDKYFWKKVEIIKQNTPELREKVDNFINEYKDISNSFFKLRTYLQGLNEGEWFFIISSNKSKKL